MAATIEITGAVSASPALSLAPQRGAKRWASLDGLRAISILMVIVGHLSGTNGFFRADFGIGDYAHLGVVVFFVISGFLITSLLLSEHEENGKISLRLFYARRAVRIFPASYAYIAFVCIVWWFGLIHIRATDLWHSVSYTVNYLPNAAWPVGHLWSLSVEEQFYLLWPFTFLVLRPRRAAWAAIAAILLGPAARMGMWFFFRGTAYRDLAFFPAVADSLATGCLLAVAKDWLERQRWYLRLFRPEISAGLLACVLLINRYFGYTIVDVFGHTILNVCLAILIHRCVYYSRGAVGRALNWRPIAFIGVLSYSLYVWQQPFLNRGSTSWACAFPENLVLAVTAALCSYFLLEKPLLRLRARLRSYSEPVASADWAPPRPTLTIRPEPLRE